MKWTTTAAALIVVQYNVDLAHAKTAGHVRRNRQLQTDDFYYPTDITKGICSNDSTGRPSSYTEIGFTLFETMEECCFKWYDWQQAGNCLRNEPVSLPKEVVPADEPATTTTESESTPSETTPDETVFFYPMDLVTGRCSSDASQRPSNFDSIGFTLFFTRELCCQYWYGWQEDQTCLLNTSTDPEIPSFNTEDPTDTPGDGGDGGSDNGGDNGGGGQSGDKFYLVNNVCTSNGVMGGEYYSKKFDCCTNILDFDMRKNCCNESVDDPGTQLECLLIEASEPAGEGGDDPAVQGGDDPVVIEEEEQFYVSNRNCFSTKDGMDLQQSIINRVSTLYSSRSECCNSLSKEDRHACVWQNTPSAQSTPSSASHFAMGGYVIAVAACLCFQFM